MQTPNTGNHRHQAKEQENERETNKCRNVYTQMAVLVCYELVIYFHIRNIIMHIK